MAVGLAKCCEDVCESAVQAPRSYSWVCRPAEREELASVCEDTGRPGNPGASCCVEPRSKANSWKVPGCVCACLHAHHCSRAAGLEDLPATEESSSGSRMWSKLQDGWSQAQERSIVSMCVFPSNRFILISQSWEED